MALEQYNISRRKVSQTWYSYKTQKDTCARGSAVYGICLSTYSSKSKTASRCRFTILVILAYEHTQLPLTMIFYSLDIVQARMHYSPHASPPEELRVYPDLV